jgi:hypothetical protein
MLRSSFIGYFKTIKGFRHSARVLSTVWATWWTFFALFSGAGEGFKGLLHNAPNALPEVFFVASVIISWKKELIGGIALLLCAFFAFFFFHIGSNLFMLVTLILPPVLAGILFIVSWKNSKVEKT